MAHDDVKVALGPARRPARGRRPRLAAAAARRPPLTSGGAPARRQLPALRELTADALAPHGELAFLLEGDLKEARGGLRDVGVLRGIATPGSPTRCGPPVRAAHLRLLDIRDALHLAAGRRVDRLRRPGPRRRSPRCSGSPTADDAAAPGRRRRPDHRATPLDDAWRAPSGCAPVARRRRAGARPGRRAARSPADVVEQDGEVVLARAAIGPAPDPSLSLRVAAAAATRRLPIARGHLEWLAAYCPPLPAPVAGRRPGPRCSPLLGAGPGLVPDLGGLRPVRAGRRAGCRSGPGSAACRSTTRCTGTPSTGTWSRRPYEAARYAREVDRPDLLLLGALLHDVGKGLPGDHSDGRRADRRRRSPPGSGCPPPTSTLIEQAGPAAPAAARRGHPARPGRPGDHRARRRGGRRRRARSSCCTRSSGPTRAATGPAAWSDWKGRLVADLVAPGRDAALDTGVAARRRPPRTRRCAGAGAAAGRRSSDRDRVAVAAADRRGLLAAVAGCLALHRLDVVAADAVHGRRPGRCVELPGAAPLRRAARTRIALAADLRRAALGDVLASPSGSPAASAADRPPRVPAPPPRGLAPRGRHRRAPCWSCAPPTRPACSTGWPRAGRGGRRRARRPDLHPRRATSVDAFYRDRPRRRSRCRRGDEAVVRRHVPCRRRLRGLDRVCRAPRRRCSGLRGGRGRGYPTGWHAPTSRRPDDGCRRV